MNTLPEKLDLHDSERDREVPVCLYPAQGSCRGWILFSVGFGGGREGYGYLARAWAQAGLSVAVIEHVGSNLSVLKSLPGNQAQRYQQVVEKVQDPAELRARPADLILVYRHLKQRYQGLPLGVGGHSYGSYTALTALGALPMPVELPQGLISEAASGLLISPQPPGMLFSAQSYAAVKVPSLVLTGTQDHLLNGAQDFQARLEVFKRLPAEYANLVVLEGVAHMTFAGLGLKVESTLKRVAALTTDWWQTTLLEDSTASERADRLSSLLQDRAWRVQ